MIKRNLYNHIFDKTMIIDGYRGSIAHNLYIPREADDVFGIDDIDYFSIFTYPLNYYFSLESYNHAGEVEDKKIEENDTVQYAIHKAFHLLSQCNPNILSFLYNRPEHYVKVSEGGKMLLENREVFLAGRRIRDAFAGDAYAQLRKLTEGSYKGYMGDRRKNVVDKYGYDTKNAATLVRLLRQGIELLTTGELITYRVDDRDFLLSIKTGQFTLSQVQEMADKEFKKLDAAYDNTKLPKENNRATINALLVDILRLEFGMEALPTKKVLRNAA